MSSSKKRKRPARHQTDHQVKPGQKASIAQIRFAIALMFFIVTTGLLLSKGGVTGRVVGAEQFETYQQQLGMTFTEDSEFNITLDTPLEEFELRTFRLGIHIKGEGRAKAILQDPAGESYIIFNENTAKSRSLNIVTGNIIGVTEIDGIGSDTGSEESETKEDTREITTVLEYNTGTKWDEDDDGFAYIEDGVVDMTVENTEFNWAVDEDKLCTKWTIRSDETDERATTCNGNDDCCSVVGTDAEEVTWDSPLYLFHGKYGSTENNAVTAQAIFVNQSTEKELSFDSVIGSSAVITASFIEKPQLTLPAVCLGTCVLPEGITSHNYRIRFELDEGLELTITNATFTVNNLATNETYVNTHPAGEMITSAPIGDRARPIDTNVPVHKTTPVNSAAVKEINKTNQTQNATKDAPITKSADLDVEQGKTQSKEKVKINPTIKDAKDKTVDAIIEFYDQDGKLKAKKNIKTSEESELETANKKKKNKDELEIAKGIYDVKIEIINGPVKSIDINDIVIHENNAKFLELDDVSEESGSEEFEKIYAIDPTAIKFKDALVTVTAHGNHLNKCKKWDFKQEKCNREWIKILDIVPGEEYTFTLTPDDPGFAESETDLQPSDAQELQIYRIQPTSIQKNHRMDAAITIYNSGENDATIQDVKETWSADAIIKGEKKLNSCDPACTADENSESIMWTGTHTIPAKGVKTFKYNINVGNTPNLLITDSAFSSNATYESTENIKFTRYSAVAYLQISKINTTPREVIGPLKPGTQHTFLLTLSEIGGQKKIKAGQTVVLELPPEWTNTGSADSDVSVIGQQITYTVPSNFKAGEQTFTFYADSPEQQGAWLFDSTLTGTDEAGETHSDIFELLAITDVPDSTPPGTITDLNEIATGKNWILWEWTNPIDADFAEALVFIDGINTANLSNSSYNATGLSGFSSHTIIVHTKDILGNVNNTDVSDNAMTLDDIAPQYSDIKDADGVIYASEKEYMFNITCTDNIGIDSAILELDGVNQSEVSSSGDEYYITINDLSAGTHNYQWYCSDFLANMNSTGTRQFNISKTGIILTLESSPGWNTAEGTEINVSCSSDNDKNNIQLYRDSENVSNPDITTLPVGQYTYDCTAEENQNYTSALITRTLNVTDKPDAVLNITVSPSWTEEYGTETTVNCSADNDDSVPELYRNGIPVNLPDTIILGAGTYNYVCNSTETQNYKPANTSSFMTITKAPTSTTIFLDGTAGDISVTYGETTNATAVTSAGTTKLYRNGALVSTPEITSLFAGTYNYTAINNGNENHTGSSASSILTVEKADPAISLHINGISDNVTAERLSEVNVTGTIIQGDAVSLTIYKNGEVLASGTSQLTDISTYNSTGTFNITLSYPASTNHDPASRTLWLTITDLNPPSAVNNLDETGTGKDWIAWNWTNPADSDFTEAIIFINDVNVANTSGSSYNATGLSGYTTYTIGIETKDIYGNINTTRATDSVRTRDNLAPTYANISDENRKEYAPSGHYRFNITWTDNAGIDSAIFEFDDVNHTNPSISGNTYSFVISAVPAGDHTYIWYANDAEGNTNSTGQQTFTINKKPTSLQLLASPDWNATYGTQTTISCSADNDAVSENLYRNGRAVNNPDTADLSAGEYEYTCNNTATQNYAAASNSNNLSINKAQSSVRLKLNGADGNRIVEIHSTMNETGLLLTGESGIEIYEDGTQVISGPSPQIRIRSYDIPGKFNVTVKHPETENYSASESTHLVTVKDTTAPTINLISPADNAIISDVSQNFMFNFTDNDNNTSNCTLYINDIVKGTDDSASPEVQNTISYNPLNEGENIWKIICTDASGNTGTSESRTINIDTEGPAITLIRPAEGDYIGHTAIIDIDLNSEIPISRAWFEIKNGAEDIIESGTLESPEYTYEWNTTQANDADYTITAYANDTLGNLAMASAVFTVNNNWPFIQIIYPKQGDILNSDILLNITYQDFTLEYTGYNITDETSAVQSRHIEPINSPYYALTDDITISSLDDGEYIITAYAYGSTSIKKTRQSTFMIDKTAPAYTGMQGPAGVYTYSPTSEFTFNISWTDADEIETVVFELDEHNRTISGETSWSARETTLSVGTHTYRWHATDSTGNRNSTRLQTFTIDKAANSCLLVFDKSSPQEYKTTITANCTCTSPETASMLMRSGADVTNTENNNPVQLPAGTWNYSCTSAETQNYLPASDNAEFIIDASDIDLELVATPGWTTTYGTQTIVTCTSNNEATAPNLYYDGNLVSRPHIATIDAGSHHYVCNSSETANFAAASSANTLTINKQESSILLTINGCSMDKTIEKGSWANITAAVITGTGNVSIYKDGILLDSGASASSYARYDTEWIHNITAVYEPTQNYAASTTTLMMTVDDTIAPEKIDNLLLLGHGIRYLYWVWQNPSDEDFDHVEIYLDGELVKNTTQEFFYATGLDPITEYEIAIRAVDDSGTKSSWVNETQTTLPICGENWQAVFGICQPGDKRIKQYLDSKTCGTTNILPEDNGTFVGCDCIQSTRFSIDGANFSSEDITNITNLKISITSVGDIEFNENINIVRCLDLDSYIDIGQNHAYVDSAAIPELNVTSEVTLHNITFANPRILADGTACRNETCQIIRYENGTLVFTVAHFTNYTVEESPYCGDGMCNGEDTCSNCALDCGSCAPAPSGGSGGGGGGGGSSSNKPKTCEPDWMCYSWGPCVKNQQTRICFDANDCGNDSEMPYTEQLCAEGCAERWACGDWTTCSSAGIKTRICNDLDHCGTEKRKPETVIPCTYNHCNDTILNFDEEGVDCGGSECRNCTAEEEKSAYLKKQQLITGEAITIPPYAIKNKDFLLPLLLLLALLTLVLILYKSSESKKARKVLSVINISLMITIFAVSFVLFDIPQKTGYMVSAISDTQYNENIGPLVIGVVLFLLIALGIAIYLALRRKNRPKKEHPTMKKHIINRHKTDKTKRPVTRTVPAKKNLKVKTPKVKTPKIKTRKVKIRSITRKKQQRIIGRKKQARTTAATKKK